MLYAGLDLSRKRLDFHALRGDGTLVEQGAVPPDTDGLAKLVYRLSAHDREVVAVIARRELVPAIWLPDPEVRSERERARFRLHLVRQRTRLKSTPSTRRSA